MTNYIKVAEDVVETIEQLGMYWDAKGLDMHIAVKDGINSAIIAITSRHWSRVNYITTHLTPEEAWSKLQMLAKKIARTLVISESGPYVCFPKLNAKQTENVRKHLMQLLDDIKAVDIIWAWELHWDLTAVVPPPNSEWVS